MWTLKTARIARSPDSPDALSFYISLTHPDGSTFTVLVDGPPTGARPLSDFPAALRQAALAIDAPVGGQIPGTTFFLPH